MKLCGREECVYKSFQKMIDKMKEELVKTQSVVYGEQLTVAKIYDIAAALLAEACRCNFQIERASCEPSTQSKSDKLSFDTFILLNQLKEDGFITEEYKKTIFDALIKLKPEIEKSIRGDSSGMI